VKCKIGFILAFILLFSVAAFAAPAKPIVKADTTYYDVETGMHVLKGNVYIEVNNRITTAGQAKVSLNSMEIWGSGGVTLIQGDIDVKADRVHVISSERKAVIEGAVTFRRPNLTIVADKVEFNWGTKLSVFDGNVKVTQGDKTWMADSVSYNVDTNLLL